MKEPWKKTCNGKVIITLNDEKTTPTEVEVPVDLNWTNRSEKKCSAPKAIILVGVVLVLGLTVVTLFKVQNLVYSTSYINWRMQELESAVSDSNDDVKLIKYKLSLEERLDIDIVPDKAARAEPLIASGNSKNRALDSQDLKLSESQNQNHKLSNSLNSETKNSKDAETQTKGLETNGKNVPQEEKSTKSESTELNDGREHANPSDPEEWIKPLVETFDIFGNQPIEDHFIQNVLMKLLMPENNFEVLEFNKMQEANHAAQEPESPKMILNPLIRSRERINKPLPLPIESILMKTLLPPVSNFKIFHFNEKPEQQQPQPQIMQQQPQLQPQLQQGSIEDEMMPKMAFQNMKLKQMLPPIEGLVKSLLPPNNMKIFQFNDKQEPNAEEDMPKITIQSIKLKLLPLPPQEDFSGRRDSPATNLNNNFEVIRLNESPEPSQEVEAPKMSMPIANFNPFSIPIQDILMKTILPSSKNIEIVPLRERPEEEQTVQQSYQPHPLEGDMGLGQQEKFNPLPIPIQDIVMKTLMPPPSQSGENHYNSEAQDQNSQEVEVTKIPVRTMKVNHFPLNIPGSLIKSMLPLHMGQYGDPMVNIHESQHEEAHPQEEEQQHQQQPQPQQPQQSLPQHQPLQLQPQQQPQPQQHQEEEVPRALPRSTKLNPVDAPWNMAPPAQYPSEPIQN